MKFRIKILICNIILIAASFSVCGVFMIRHSYKTALKSEIQESMKQNQMAQTLLEQEITKLVVSGVYDGVTSLRESNLFHKFDGETKFYIFDETEKIIWGEENITEEERELLRNGKKGNGQNAFYRIIGEDENAVIAVVSSFQVNNEEIYLMSVSSMESLYNEVHSNLRYFQVMRIIALAVSSVLVYIIVLVMTGSLKKLRDSVSKISEGEYSVRTEVSTTDEIGELAAAFNQMADAIEEQMEKLQEEAVKKEDFVANFTHEIKTPMTSIIGYADEIRRSPDSSEKTVYDANYIYNEGMRLEKMSMKLFDLILLERKGIAEQTVWIQSLMEEVAETVKPSFRKKQIALEVEYMDVCVSGDYEMLKTVFINLLDNARKASSERAKVEFVCMKETDEVITIMVKDYGCGIAKKDLDKIHEMFYMADKSRSRKEGGAGLGLALVDKIIKSHGGQMTIESEWQKGTSVKIYLKEAEQNEEI